MSFANLGGVQFRLDPESIQYSYTIDYSIIDTLGGRVIQVLGSTISDITITGLFGQQRPSKHNNFKARESWQLAESFGAQIRALMDKQIVPPKKTAGGGVHSPLRFTYHDGVHNWDMKVLIKGYEDLSGNGSIEHTYGKFSYGYKLTLFLVEDSSLTLSRVQSDKFISRISKGLGWKDTTYGKFGSFSGSDTADAAMAFLEGTSTDGTYIGYLDALATGGLPGAAASQTTSSSGTTSNGGGAGSVKKE